MRQTHKSLNSDALELPIPFRSDKSRNLRNRNLHDPVAQGLCRQLQIEVIGLRGSVLILLLPELHGRKAQIQVFEPLRDLQNASLLKGKPELEEFLVTAIPLRKNQLDRDRILSRFVAGKGIEAKILIRKIIAAYPLEKVNEAMTDLRQASAE